MSKQPSLRQLQLAQSAQGLSTSATLPATDLWQAWFDGAALPNPGKIGLGVVLLSPTGVRTEHAIKTALHGCNNEAELHALIAALDLARADHARQLLLQGDSQVAIQHANGQETTNIERLNRLVVATRQMRQHFDVLELRWIPRHRNADADRLSRAALGLAPKPL